MSQWKQNTEEKHWDITYHICMCGLQSLVISRSRIEIPNSVAQNSLLGYKVLFCSFWASRYISRRKGAKNITWWMSLFADTACCWYAKGVAGLKAGQSNMETIFLLEVKYFSQFHPSNTFKRNMGCRNLNWPWQIFFFETSGLKKKEKKLQCGPKQCFCFVLVSVSPIRFIAVAETSF